MYLSSINSDSNIPKTFRSQETFQINSNLQCLSGIEKSQQLFSHALNLAFETENNFPNKNFNTIETENCSFNEQAVRQCLSYNNGDVNILNDPSDKSSIVNAALNEQNFPESEKFSNIKKYSFTKKISDENDLGEKILKLPINIKKSITHSDNNKRIFNCDQCQKSFSTKKNLKFHISNHDESMPFENNTPFIDT